MVLQNDVVWRSKGRNASTLKLSTHGAEWGLSAPNISAGGRTISYAGEPRTAVGAARMAPTLVYVGKGYGTNQASF